MSARDVEGFTPIGPGARFPVAPFFAMIFASWLVWIPAGARMAGVLPFPFPAEIAWLGVFVPFIVGTYLTARAGGARALARYFARFARWRIDPAYWGYAIFAIPFATAACVVIAVGGDVEALQAGLEKVANGDLQKALMVRYSTIMSESIGPFDYLLGQMSASTATFVGDFLALALLDGGISEEPGWRGYAYPILHARWGALPAALTVGLFWALWHLGPMQWKILFADGIDAFAAFLPEYAMIYAIIVLPLAIVFAWLYESSGGSLLVCFVVHAVYNMTVTIAGALFPTIEMTVTIGVIVFLWLSAIGILVVRGWKNFAPVS